MPPLPAVPPIHLSLKPAGVELARDFDQLVYVAELTRLGTGVRNCFRANSAISDFGNFSAFAQNPPRALLALRKIANGPAVELELAIDPGSIQRHVESG